MRTNLPRLPRLHCFLSAFSDSDALADEDVSEAPCRAPVVLLKLTNDPTSSRCICIPSLEVFLLPGSQATSSPTEPVSQKWRRWWWLRVKGDGGRGGLDNSGTEQTSIFSRKRGRRSRLVAATGVGQRDARGSPVRKKVDKY